MTSSPSGCVEPGGVGGSTAPPTTRSRFDVRQLRALSILAISARTGPDSLSGLSQRQRSRWSCGTLGVGPSIEWLQPSRRPSFSTSVHDCVVGLPAALEASHDAEFT